jgi:Flp pilus assembly protein TadG
MKRHRSNKPDDSGAILIYAVFAVIGLVAFTTLVVDYGVFWTARRQAQNVADAAAMAGAVALAYEGPVDWTSAGAAVNSALATAQSNLIWGEAPGSGIVATDITFAKSPSSCVITDCAACPVRVYTCVRAEVFRNAARNNPLPSFFGVLIGINSQEMKATATARSAPANASACVRPFVVPDRYSEVSGDPNLFDGGDIYNSYGYLFANTFGQLSGAIPLDKLPQVWNDKFEFWPAINGENDTPYGSFEYALCRALRGE